MALKILKFLSQFSELVLLFAVDIPKFPPAVSDFIQAPPVL
jgi:hypothetical protein